MIGQSDMNLLSDFALGSITLQEFESTFSYGLSPESMFKLFRWVVLHKEEHLLFSITQYFFKTKFVDGVCCIYNDLLLQDWHKYHDTIAGILQFDLRDCCSTMYFKESIALKFSYLFESDDYEPYVTKCMWGIAKTDSDYSKEVLVNFTRSDDEIVKNAAIFQVERLGLARYS